MPRLAIAFLLCLVASGTFAAAQTRAKESNIKAAFVYNFAKFVYWPQEAFAGPGDRLYVCVSDTDPFGEVLQETIHGRTAQSRTIEVRRWEAGREVGPCNIVVFDSSTAIDFTDRRREFEEHHVLTVAELEDFAEHGGIINFIRAGSNVRFQVNPAAASRSSIRISSQLLKLADIVTDRPPGEGG